MIAAIAALSLAFQPVPYIIRNRQVNFHGGN